MKYLQEAIRDAGGHWKPDEDLFEGGIWDFNDGYYHLHHLLLTPAFWQALGKARMWGAKACMECGFNGRFDDYHGDCGKCMGKEYAGWLYQWHRFIDARAEGRTAEEFFEGLAGKK